MSIISTIGRKQNKVRGLFLGMYLFLIIGGATMVYPFLLMISGSTKSAMDIQHFDVVPRFLYDRDWMFGKHLEGLFNERLNEMNYIYDCDEFSFDKLGEAGVANEQLAAAWDEFIEETNPPAYSFIVGYLETPQSRTVASAQRDFKHQLETKYGKDIADVNRALGTEFMSWNNVSFTASRLYMRRDKPQNTPFTMELNEFMAKAPVGLRTYFSPDGFYRKLYLKAKRTVAGEGTQPDMPRLTRRYPKDAPLEDRQDWERFVREVLCSAWVRVDASALGEYHNFLKAKYPDTAKRKGLEILNERYATSYTSFQDIPVYVTNVELERQNLQAKHNNSIDSFNKQEGTAYTSFKDVPLAETPPFLGVTASDWDAFLIGFKVPGNDAIHQAPLDSLIVHSVEFSFQDWLAKQFKTLDEANAKLGTNWKSFDDIRMPQRDTHLTYFDTHINELRWEFITRNYKTVFDYLLFHGRGIVNTIIYCSLAILTALLVNPLAAYAMSRYRMPSTYKILLFMMCTMAFPPMVTAIPNFIMLRQFNMLNTFWALILPGMANGYSIFLLKGFFDSLPKELYESAQLDGASEWTLFWQITMGLSKPILAVIALNAFTAAYSNFMFAFVVCQDRKMWTMMVWLYEMQQRYGQAVSYASLVIAAIPTFLIFLFCQNIIMRGIVVPSEK